MAKNGKEYKIAIRIAGVIDKSYAVALTGAEAQLKGFVAKVNGIHSGLSDINTVFDKVGRVGAATFRAVATAAGAAAVAIGAVAAASIKVGMDFEKQMSAVEAISGANVKEMNALTMKARELAGVTIYDATEIGKAYEYMGMAGWKAEQMMSGIKPVIDLAAASGEDLAMVSDIVTDYLTAFNMEADEAQRLVDVMAQTAMNANTNIEKMGYTFKYAAPLAGAMGYSVEDIAIATGIMASSGTKATVAGTSLRNLLTRMAKPTKESAQAMEALGLSLTDDEGRMYSFMEIMQQIRKAFNGDEKSIAALTELGGLTDEQIKEIEDGLGDLSETEKAFYAAELGGARGMTGLLTIANASEEQFQNLTDAIYNAEGAADRMQQIRLDNLSGDVTLLVDAAKDAGIDIYYELNDQLRSIVQMATGWIKEAKTGVTDFFKGLSENLPTFKRKFDRYAGPVIDTVVNTAKWLVKNGTKVVSIIAGLAAAFAGFKVIFGILSAISGIVGHIGKIVEIFGKASGAVFVLEGAVLAVVAAIGLVTAAIVNAKLEEERAIDDSLKNHFGEITLSIEDLQRASETILQSKCLEETHAALAAYKDLEGIGAEIDSITTALNKYSWEKDLGIQLTEEEKEDLQNQLEQYMKETQDWLTQSQYTATLNLQAILPDGVLEEGALAATNEEYAQYRERFAFLGRDLNDAMTDAFNDELLQVDQDAAWERVKGILTMIAKVKEQIAGDEFNVQMKMLGLEYGGASLTADSFQNLQTQLSEDVNEALHAYDEVYARALVDLDRIGANESLYKAAAAERLENRKNTILQAFNFQTGTIEASKYGEDIQQAQAAMDAILKEYFSNDYKFEWQNNPVNMWDMVYDELSKTIDKYDREAIARLLETMREQRAQLGLLVDEYKEAGQQVPQDLMDAITTFDEMSVLSGDWDYDQMYQYIGGKLLENPEYERVLENASSIGNAIPEEMYKAMGDQANALGDPAADKLYNAAQDALNNAPLRNGVLDADWGVEVTLHATSVNVPQVSMFQSKPSLANQMSGSVMNPNYQSPADKIAGALGNNGSTMDMWDKVTSQGSGTSINWAYSYKPANQPTPYGGQTSASDLAHLIDEVDRYQNVIDHNALGGIIRSKELSWLAENGPEAVIPLDGSERARELWEMAGQMIGAGNELSRMQQNSEGFGNMESAFSRMDTGTVNNESYTIEYKPTLQFYGGTPSREDLEGAMEMSQERFDEMMEQWTKNRGRVSY